VEVTGSNPVPPTSKFKGLRFLTVTPFPFSLPFWDYFLPIPYFPTAGSLLMRAVVPGLCRDNLADAIRFKSINLSADDDGQEVAMKTGFEFIQRITEDAEFCRKVHACLDGEERLAFVKSEGYDFSPFIQILNNLSSGKQSTGGWGRPGASPRRGAPGFFGRISRILRATKAPRLNR
jgi:hypothetical protein